MFLLDTNLVSELRKVRSSSANGGVEEWVSTTPVSQMFVSAITIHELERGVLLKERSDPEQGALLRTWLDESVAAVFGPHVLPVDDAVARCAATFHVPDPAPLSDALIAATAVVHRMTVVTRNSSDFERFDGVEVVNPWT